MGVVSSILGIAASLLEWGAARFRAMQSPAMKANAAAQTEQTTRDEVTKDVASGELTAIEKDISP